MPEDDGAADEPHIHPRDRGYARRCAFLEAARTVFFAQGYEHASINEIVRLAGGSLATLYAQFGSKEGLFLTVAEEQHERVIRAMTPDCVNHLTLEEGLTAIGAKFLRALLEPDTLALFRIIVSEGQTFPETVRRYWSTGAERVRTVVADFLIARSAQVENPAMAASYLLELLRARHHYRALGDHDFRLSEEDLAAHVEAAVRFFLRAVRP